MCALDAAGFAADESTLSEMPSRLALREAMLKMQGPATEALRQFYRDHLLADSGRNIVALHHVFARRRAAASFRFSGESRFAPAGRARDRRLSRSSRSLLSGGASRSASGRKFNRNTSAPPPPTSRPSAKSCSPRTAICARLSSRYTTARLPFTSSRSWALARIFAILATTMPSSWARRRKFPSSRFSTPIFISCSIR